jgi:hypothetical protein
VCEEPLEVVQETPDGDLAGRYGSVDEPGHCSLTYQWTPLAAGAKPRSREAPTVFLSQTATRRLVFCPSCGGCGCDAGQAQSEISLSLGEGSDDEGERTQAEGRDDADCGSGSRIETVKGCFIACADD